MKMNCYNIKLCKASHNEREDNFEMKFCKKDVPP